MDRVEARFVAIDSPFRGVARSADRSGNFGRLETRLEPTSRMRPDNFWLYHLLKADDRDRRALDLEDRVRIELEAVVSRLVRDGRSALGPDSIPSHELNARAVNLVLQQALDLQREHAPESHGPMIVSLLHGDPALARALMGVRAAFLAGAAPSLNRQVSVIRKNATRRGALMGGVFGVVAATLLALV